MKLANKLDRLKNSVQQEKSAKRVERNANQVDIAKNNRNKAASNFMAEKAKETTKVHIAKETEKKIDETNR